MYRVIYVRCSVANRAVSRHPLHHHDALPQPPTSDTIPPPPSVSRLRKPLSGIARSVGVGGAAGLRCAPGVQRDLARRRDDRVHQQPQRQHHRRLLALLVAAAQRALCARRLRNGRWQRARAAGRPHGLGRDRRDAALRRRHRHAKRHAGELRSQRRVPRRPRGCRRCVGGRRGRRRQQRLERASEGARRAGGRRGERRRF